MSSEKSAQQVWLGDGPWPKLQVHGTLHVQASLRSPEIRHGVFAASVAAARARVGASNSPPSIMAVNVGTCLRFIVPPISPSFTMSIIALYWLYVKGG